MTHPNPHKRKVDWLLWLSGLGVFAGILLHLIFPHMHESWLGIYSMAVFDLSRQMFWGVVAGIVAMGFIGRVPREFVTAILGRAGGVRGVLRAAAAGVLLDLCSHGILMVGAKLYERGASAGQVMAFLLASPWNSFSLTLILVALIGLPWTLVFIVASMAIGIITGVIFDMLVARGTLPKNPNTTDLPEDFKFWAQAKQGLKSTRWTPKFFVETLWLGVKDSRMVVRWLLLGIVLAAVIRVLFSPENYGTYFGPSILGLCLTLLAATVIEVCSEGSTPIAADLVTRAGAVGNGFTFLMAGVATDYTEMMVLREVTKSWKIPLFLPLITVPQVLLVGYILNSY